MLLNKPKNQQVSSKVTGFALVEVLVAISMIAILASLLFSVFSVVRNKAQVTSCASNLHQLYSALSMYAADNGGFLPIYPGRGGKPYDHLHSASPCFQVGDELLSSAFPYTHSMDVWLCPSDHTDYSAFLASCGLSSPNKTSYYYPLFIDSSGPHVRSIDSSGHLLSRFNNTLLHDNIFNSHSRSNEYAQYNHRGRSNYLFCDGHVKSLIEPEVVQ